MLEKKLWPAIILLLFSVQVSADIFGRDDRKWPETGSLSEEQSRSVAVGVLTSLVAENGRGSFDIFADKMSDYVCSNERFSSEPSISYACTGFLIAPDLLVTAGHCVTNHEEVFYSQEGYCPVYAWVFDYVQTSNMDAATENIDPSNVFRCKQIIYAVADEEDPLRDFAVIQLDRPTKRKPLALSFSSSQIGDRVSMLGFPMGMPMKHTDNATIVSVQKQVYTTNLDAFQGNSGSPVFNESNEVIGVLVSGSPSEGTFYDSSSKCKRYNYCDDKGHNCKSSHTPKLDTFPPHGSDVEKILHYQDLLQSLLN